MSTTSARAVNPATTAAATDRKSQLDRFVDKTGPKIDLGNFVETVYTLRLLNNSISKDIAVLRKVQTEEFKLTTLYQDAWKTAKTIFEARLKTSEQYPSISNGNHPAEYHIALIAYTLDTPKLYEDFNVKTRNLKTPDDIQNYTYKSLFKFLLLASENVYGTPSEVPKTTILYRGCRGSAVGAVVGKYVIFQQFCSSTLSLKLAGEFTDTNDTIFVINGIREGAMGTGMDDHTVFPNEQEILLWPNEYYLITAIKMQDERPYIYLKP